MHYLAIYATVQNHTRTQKPHARDDTLDDPARIGIRVFCDRQNRNCRCKRNESQRSHSCRLVLQLKIYSEHGSDCRRRAKSKNNFRPIKHKMISPWR